jgi:uncharacterized protein YbgA (DUF1722 family)/uncharacterized protein YbbK (DUF523 family)
MGKFAKPRVVVSKCIEYDHCRYNGLMISSDVVKLLRPFVDFIPVCPEVEIGLGIPRDPIRVVGAGDEERLVQPATGKDLTDSMRDFAARFLCSLGGVDGFILKGRSPSCGMGSVKVYKDAEKGGPISKTNGFFGGAVLERFPGLPAEDEGRLTNFRIREHFFTRIFSLAGFREAKAEGAMRSLVQFQTEYKLLLMAYNQKELRALGRIVANPKHKTAGEAFEDYEGHFRKALLRPARYTSDINVMMHAFGYFSKDLSREEKAFFLGYLDEYREGKIPLSACLGILRSWIVRFEEDYLATQRFFEPYPAELVQISDSGKGRKM